MSLKSEREAALKSISSFNQRIKAGEALSDDDKKTVADLIAQVEDLDARMSEAAATAELVSKIGAMSTDETATGNDEPVGEPVDDGDAGTKNVGRTFMKRLKSAGRHLGDGHSFQADVKADPMLVGRDGGPFGPYVTDADREGAWPVRRPLAVADLLGSGTVSGNALTYPVYPGFNPGAGFVAEGGQKPKLGLADPTWRTDALKEVAAFFRVTDDMMEDIPYVVSEINAAATYDLQLREEIGILTGDGAGANLLGLVHREGVQSLSRSGKDTNADAVFRAISAVQEKSGMAADGIVINPADYTELRLSKDNNGQYFGGGLFGGQYGNGAIMEQPPLWGVRTVVTSSIPAGTVLVGSFAQGAKLFRKGVLRVETTNAHGEDFAHDVTAIRIRERLGLQVKFPMAFAKVTLGGSPTPPPEPKTK